MSRSTSCHRSSALLQACIVLAGLLAARCDPSSLDRVGIDITHRYDELPIRERVRLDVSVADAAGTAVPWEDLRMHHGRKVHVYALHEVCALYLSASYCIARHCLRGHTSACSQGYRVAVTQRVRPRHGVCVKLHGARDALTMLQGLGYMQHLHPEDFEVDTQLAGATSFPIWLMFPEAGVWTFHTSVDLTPPRARAPVTVSREQTLRVGGAAAAVRNEVASATAGLDRNASYLTTVLASPSHKGAAPQGHDAMATLPAARAVPGAMAVTIATPSGGIYEHECSRLVFEFSDAETGQPVDALLPWLHASMHVLDVAPAAADASDGYRGATLAQSHGVPEALDEAVLGGDQQHGLDLCNVEMERVPTAAAATGGTAFGPRMVWYARFAGAGTHYAFVQVRVKYAV